jgi:hypothetical protein
MTGQVQGVSTSIPLQVCSRNKCRKSSLSSKIDLTF